VDKLTDLATQVQGAIAAITATSRELLAPPKRGKRAAAAAAPRRARDIRGAPLRVLCVHGIGDHHTDLSWRGAWTDAILNGLRTWNPTVTAVTDFVVYDDLFDDAKLHTATVAAAVWKLVASGIWHAIGDSFQRQRGLTEMP